MQRGILRDEVSLWFNGPDNEHGRMDFRDALAGLRCPTLVMAGEEDPITPIAFSETLVQCLPRDLVRFERFAGCGHGVVPDDPERAFHVMREFILAGD
jgi:proline iminopeptidase